jgi:hypothetical protein
MTSQTSIKTDYPAYVVGVDLGMVASRIVIIADQINGRGSELFGNLMAEPDALKRISILHDALDVIDDFIVSAQRPAVQS